MQMKKGGKLQPRMVDRFVLSVGGEVREEECPDGDKEELDITEEFNVHQEPDLL